MKIIQTTFNELGPIQIQDHGIAFIVSYPSTEHKGSNFEKVFTKAIGSNAWNKARSFAASQKGEAK
tara:strand:+ start:255 stop:452 length:198 start_codon:yes stop_codon:yes gene_type:complete